MNRREFLKTAGVTTALAGAAIATKPSKAFAIDLAKEVDDYPYEVTSDFKGFSSRNVMFMRIFWDGENFSDDYISKTYENVTPTETGLSFFQ